MAKNDGKIYITISDTRGGKGGPGTNPNISPDGKKEKEDDKNLLSDYAKHQFFNLIKSQATQAVNYTISNIGNFTGNYTAQVHVSEAMSMLNDFKNLGLSAYVGFKVAGPWGAVIAAGTQVVSKGVNIVQQIVAGYAENTRINKNISQLRTRAGLNSTNNGSRGTEY